MKSSDLFEVMRNRRSVRQWTARDVPDELIKQLVDAARWAPCSHNRNSWRFIILKDKKSRELVGEGVMGGAGVAKNAPVLIVVVMDPRSYRVPEEEGMIWLDTGIAVQNILLMAHQLGLGACPLFWKTTEENEQLIRTHLNFPPYLSPRFLIALGYPDVPIWMITPNLRARRPIEDIVKYERFMP